MTIKTEYICPRCGVHFLKDPFCSGDYYPTIIGIVLQSYCPVCGDMKPLVDELYDEETISNKRKKGVFTRCASEKNDKFINHTDSFFFKFKKIKRTDEFVYHCSRYWQLPVEKVASFI